MLLLISRGFTRNKVKFYHGTNKQAWNAIQKEGILWGPHSYRYTYLTPNINLAIHFGKDIILEIEYRPVGCSPNLGIDNYAFSPEKGQKIVETEYCWQFSVFVPIPLKNVKKLNNSQIEEIKNKWDVLKWNRIVEKYVQERGLKC